MFQAAFIASVQSQIIPLRTGKIGQSNECDRPRWASAGRDGRLSGRHSRNRASATSQGEHRFIQCCHDADQHRALLALSSVCSPSAFSSYCNCKLATWLHRIVSLTTTTLTFSRPSQTNLTASLGGGPPPLEMPDGACLRTY